VVLEAAEYADKEAREFLTKAIRNLEKSEAKIIESQN